MTGFFTFTYPALRLRLERSSRPGLPYRIARGVTVER